MLEQFFDPSASREYHLFFSTAHIIILIVFFICVTWLYTHRYKSYMSHIRWIVFYSLILSEIGLLSWTIYFGSWDIRYNLPLHLCTISLLLSAYMLYKKSHKVFEIIYFFGLGGALQAILTPDLFYTFPHFRFLHFFLAHFAIVLAILYMIWVYNYKVTIISAVKSFIVLNILAFIVYWINFLIGSNYMFLARKPDGQSILDFLGPYPWYILYLEIIAVVIFFLLYLPFLLKKIYNQK